MGRAAPITPPATATAPVSPAPGSPTRLYDMAWADYTAGSYDLAIEGFTSYVRSFPRSEFADNAQYYIGESYFQRGRLAEAVEAFGRVISTYPKSDVVGQAYYKRGLELRAAQPAGSRPRGLRLPDQDGARQRRRPPGQAAARRAEPGPAAIVPAGTAAALPAAAGRIRKDDDTMGSVNKVILVGNLGRDAEVRFTPSGAPVASFSIATTENWTARTARSRNRRSGIASCCGARRPRRCSRT